MRMPFRWHAEAEPDGVCDPCSAIESLRPQRFQSKVPVNPDAADQDPKNFHQEGRQIEVNEK